MRKSSNILVAAGLMALLGVSGFLVQRNYHLREMIKEVQEQEFRRAQDSEAIISDLMLATNRLTGLLEATRVVEDESKARRDTLEIARLRARVAELTKLANELQQQLLTTHSGPEGLTNEQPRVPIALTEEQLSGSQKIALHHLTKEVNRGNSIADIDRLKHSLNRWDELWVKDAPEDVKPIFMLLKEKVRERLEVLENEKARLEQEQQSR